MFYNIEEECIIITNQEILSKYAESVYLTARKHTTNAADAETIFQEVFCQYAMHRPKYQTEADEKMAFTNAAVKAANAIAAVRPSREAAAQTEEAAPAESSVPNALMARTLSAMSESAAPQESAAEPTQSTAPTAPTATAEPPQDETKPHGTIKPSHIVKLAAIAIIAPVFLVVAGAAARTASVWILSSLGMTMENYANRVSANQTMPAYLAQGSADGCTVTVTEARAVNEFLYLTISEAGSGLSANDAENGGHLYNNDFTGYEGRIYDNNRQELTFDKDAMYPVKEEVIGDVSSDKESYYVKRTYKIYLPDLPDLISTAGEQYTCDITVTPRYQEEPQDAAGVNIPLTFTVSDVLGTTDSQTYALDYTYQAGELEFAFRKLCVGPTAGNMVVELIPHGTLAKNGNDLRNLLVTVTAIAYAVPEGQEDISDRSALEAYAHNEFPAFVIPVFFSGSMEFGNADGNLPDTGFYNKIVSREGRYYLFPTYESSASPQYDRDSIIAAAENGSFRVFALSYDAAEFEQNQSEYNGMTGVTLEPIYHRNRLPDDKYAKTVLNQLPAQKVKVGKLHPTTDNESGYYELKKQFQAGKFSFATTKLDEYLCSVDIKDASVGGKQVSFDGENYEFRSIAFIAEKDGTAISVYDDSPGLYVGTNEGSVNCSDAAIYSPTQPVPDTMILGYVEYAAYDPKKDQWTDYIYYNPTYYDKSGLSFEEIAEDEKIEKFNADFWKNSFFTVSQSK